MIDDNDQSPVSDTLDSVLASLAVLVMCFAFVAFGGCSRPEPPLSTGKVIAAAELPGIKGDTAYAEVSSAALPSIYATHADTLSRLGLVKWDGRFDCNHFADLYVATAQVRYAVQAWHSDNKAQTLALGVVWYVPDAARPANGHAIVMARTERGLLFIEPQTGRELRLTPAQEASAYFRKW